MLNGPCVVGPLLDLVHSRYARDGVADSDWAISPENRASPQPAEHNAVQHNTQSNEELNEDGPIDDEVDEPESYSEISLAKTYGVCTLVCTVFCSVRVMLIR